MSEANDLLVEQGIRQGIRQVGEWYTLPVYEEYAGACNSCGGKPVEIRGKSPGEPDRKICPTCTREILERIYSGCNSRVASAG